MSHRKSYNTPGHTHFLTFSCWKRQPFLLDRFALEELACSLDEARRIEQFDIWAYVFMPEHVHRLTRPRNEKYEMDRILRRIKESVARRVVDRWRDGHSSRLLQSLDVTEGPTRHRFWQPGGGYDRNLYKPDTIIKAIDYIQWNPVRRGLVATLVDWEWSSAGARAGHDNVPLMVDEVVWESVRLTEEEDVTH